MLDIDRLLESIDLADLATRAGAKLHKTGSQLRSICPLHAGSDNPTSFAISTPHGSRRQMWICHKCGAGDALHFVQKWRGVDFMEAVRFLAQEARIPLSELGMDEAAVKEYQALEKRRDVLDIAARFYQRRFRKNERAINYALWRAFTPRTLTRFGFSDGRGLAAYLKEHGADLALAREIGLLRADGLDFVANSDGMNASPDGWLVYIHRRAGRVEYLSARALSPISGDKSRNLPGTKQLYRCDIADDETVMLVEGQADAETLRQIGVSSWALCGTSLDERALRELQRRKVYLALDDDTHRGGDETLIEERRSREAQRRAKLAEALGPLTLICPELPSDKAKDLNEWLQLKPDLNSKDILAWRNRNSARTWIAIKIQEAEECGPLEAEAHICEVAALLARLPEATKAGWYKKAGKALDMTPSELRAAGGQNGHGPAADIREGQLCLYGVPLLTGAAWITNEVSVSDGANAPRVRYLITGKLRTGEPLHQIEVNAEEFDSLAWLSQWGARIIKLVSRGRYHEVTRAIQEISVNNNGSSMKREPVYAHTGIAMVNGERVFLTKSGMLRASGLDPSVKVDLADFSNMNYALPEPPRGEALRVAVRAAVDYLKVSPLRVTAPLFAAMCAAPLTSVRPLNTVIWVFGSTTTGKSIIAHLALAFFAPSAIGVRKFNSMCAWNWTITTLEGAVFSPKDCPVIIDDYAPQLLSRHDADQLRQNANNLIRSIGNRQAKGRSRSDTSVRRVRNPRALVISTAEHPIEGQSLNHRLVYVPVEKGDVIKPGDNPVLDKAEEQGAAGLYAQAMSAFICWLLAHWETATEQFNTMVDADVISSRSQFASGMDRQPDYFAILNSSQRLALKAWAEMGALDPAEAGRIAEANRVALLAVVQGQAGRIAEQSPANMFLRAIASLIDQRKVFLAPRKTAHGWTRPERAEMVGWFSPDDKGAVWLQIEMALQQARAYWERLGIPFDVSRESLKRFMRQSGMLRKESSDGNAEVSIWTGHANARALEVDVAKVLADEQWGYDLSYPRSAEPELEPLDVSLV